MEPVDVQPLIAEAIASCERLLNASFEARAQVNHQAGREHVVRAMDEPLIDRLHTVDGIRLVSALLEVDGLLVLTADRWSEAVNAAEHAKRLFKLLGDGPRASGAEIVRRLLVQLRENGKL